MSLYGTLKISAKIVFQSTYMTLFEIDSEFPLFPDTQIFQTSQSPYDFLNIHQNGYLYGLYPMRIPLQIGVIFFHNPFLDGVDQPLDDGLLSDYLQSPPIGFLYIFALVCIKDDSTN